MKILFLSSYYPPHTKGGAEISAQLIAEGLSSLGHDIHVITAGNEAATTVQNGIKVFSLPIPLTSKPLLEQRQASKIARYLYSRFHWSKYELVHTHDFRTVLVLSELKRLAAASSRQLLAVATVRDYAPISGSTNFISTNGTLPASPLADAFLSHRISEASLFRKPFRFWQYAYNLRYRAASFAAMDAHIYISRAQQCLINQHLGVSRPQSAVIYNPVSSDYLNNPIIKGEPGLITYIGTVEKYKGVGLLLKACQELFFLFPSARLKIIGDGYDKKHYVQQVAASKWSGRVIFTGRLPAAQLISHYDAADLVVCPHVWIEPFGRTCAEAMSRGKLVIAADAGGPAEMIKDGETGLLFRRNNVNSLKEILTLALTLNQNQKNIMSGAAHRQAAENFNMDVIAKQYEAFYQRK